MIWMRGATAYEFQWGRLYIRVTYLSGVYWKFKPWRRVRVRWLRPDGTW